MRLLIVVHMAHPATMRIFRLISASTHELPSRSSPPWHCRCKGTTGEAKARPAPRRPPWAGCAASSTHPEHIQLIQLINEHNEARPLETLALAAHLEAGIARAELDLHRALQPRCSRTARLRLSKKPRGIPHSERLSERLYRDIYISLLYLYHIFISLYTSLISVSNGLGVIRVAISPRATHLGSSHLPWAARRGALVPKEQGAACNDESQRSLSRCRTIFNDFLNCEGAEAFVGTPRAEFQPKGLGEASSATLWART